MRHSQDMCTLLTSPSENAGGFGTILEGWQARSSCMLNAPCPPNGGKCRTRLGVLRRGDTRGLEQGVHALGEGLRLPLWGLVHSPLCGSARSPDFWATKARVSTQIMCNLTLSPSTAWASSVQSPLIRKPYLLFWHLTSLILFRFDPYEHHIHLMHRPPPPSHQQWKRCWYSEEWWMYCGCK